MASVIEGKTLDRDVDGYRINKPFPELLEFANSIDMNKLEDIDHNHIPYFIILIKALQEWKESVNLYNII